MSKELFLKYSFHIFVTENYYFWLLPIIFYWVLDIFFLFLASLSSHSIYNFHFIHLYPWPFDNLPCITGLPTMNLVALWLSYATKVQNTLFLFWSWVDNEIWSRKKFFWETSGNFAAVLDPGNGIRILHMLDRY